MRADADSPGTPVPLAHRWSVPSSWRTITENAVGWGPGAPTIVATSPARPRVPPRFPRVFRLSSVEMGPQALRRHVANAGVCPAAAHRCHALAHEQANPAPPLVDGRGGSCARIAKMKGRAKCLHYKSANHCRRHPIRSRTRLGTASSIIVSSVRAHAGHFSLKCVAGEPSAPPRASLRRFPRMHVEDLTFSPTRSRSAPQPRDRPHRQARLGDEHGQSPDCLQGHSPVAPP